jgi:sugar/nucleoside kinase (ribokinase family)
MTQGMIVTIGEVLVEIMAVEPGHGFHSPIHLVGPFPSGAPAIFIGQVGRLGHACGIVSCVGNDDFGRVNLERLRSDGVDVSALRVHGEAVTGSAFVRYRPDGQRDFVFNIKHSACGAIALDAAAQALLERASHLHVMGSSLFSPAIVDANRAAIAQIKDRGGTVSFDPNIRKEMMALPGMREALEHVLSSADLFLPSGPELFLFTRAQTEREAIREVLDRGVRAVVLKRGAAGASYHDARGEQAVAGLPVEEIDPTGAGDCFGATFVTCWLEEMGPGEALRMANASGALAVCKKGPMEGSSTRAEIAAFLARHSPGAGG